MKKVLCLVLALLLCAVSACAEADLSNMEIDDLIKLQESVNAEIHAKALRNEDMILFEDESISIQFDGLRVETPMERSFLIISFILNNKTDNNLTMKYDSIVINGCTLDLSKKMEIPAGSVKIDELTTDGDLYLRYNIETVETVRLLFSDEHHKQIISNTVIVNGEGAD